MRKQIKLFSSDFTLPMIQLSINGTRYNFLIDTGAEGTTMCHEILGNHKIAGTLESQGVGGKELGYMRRVKLNILEASTALVGDMNSIHVRGKTRIHGIIGQDILKQFSWYMFDVENNLFIWETKRK